LEVHNNIDTVNQTFKLKINEMEGVCDANLLMNALNKLECVNGIDIDMGLKELSCTCEGNCKVERLTKTVEGLGFDVIVVVDNQRFKLKVDEMEGVCDANLLRSALSKLECVSDINIDMGLKELICTCEGNCKVEKLTDTVTGLGFEVLVI
jgi:hypothetical protein